MVEVCDKRGCGPFLRCIGLAAFVCLLVTPLNPSPSTAQDLKPHGDFAAQNELLDIMAAVAELRSALPRAQQIDLTAIFEQRLRTRKLSRLFEMLDELRSDAFVTKFEQRQVQISKRERAIAIFDRDLSKHSQKFKKDDEVWLGYVPDSEGNFAILRAKLMNRKMTMSGLR